jgi:hypothetical protein
MPKLVWGALAGGFIGERWGWPGILGIVLFEFVGLWATGFYEAWRADRSAG